MKKKNAIILIVIIVAALVIIFGGITVYRIIWGSPAVKTTDVSDYGKRSENRIYNDLRIFPEEINISGKSTEYYYFYQDTLFDPTCQIYLSCQYSEEDYNSELERLSEIHEQYQKKDENGNYTTERFGQEAYIYKFNDNSCYEYALLNSETNEIVYVYLQFISSKQIHFDQKYLPYGYDEAE